MVSHAPSPVHTDSLHIADTQRAEHLRRQEFLNLMAWVCLSVLVLASLPALYYNQWTVMLPLAGYGFFFCAVLWLNARRHTTLAGNLLAAATSVFLFLICILEGKAVGGHMYFVPLIVGIPYLIDSNSNTQLAVHLLHPTLFSLFINFSEFSTGLTEIPADFQDLYMLFNFGFVVFLCQVFAYQIIMHNTENTYQLRMSEHLLRTRNQELMKANKELDRFVYSISHELRAPVASALGLGDLIREEEDPEEARQYNLIMLQNLKRLDGLIGDILDYSRNARHDVKPESIAFDKEIEAAVQQYQFMHADVQVVQDAPPNPAFHTDRYRFRMVLNNLVSNAFRYQNPGRADKSIRISCRVAGGRATLRVRDNGLGIAAEDQPRIFDMFYRAENPNLEKKISGSGLGLYLARESVYKIGGTMTVESARNEFTEFVVEIPHMAGPANG